jgi:iron-sulfur cluster repair protein YtfE (RIC family)
VNDRDAALVRQLIFVHDYFRNSLADLRKLIATPPDDGSMRTWAWDLRVKCLYFCNGLHAHHTGEDTQLFPAVLAESSELGTVIERLMADHSKVSEIIDAITSRVGEVASDPSGVRDDLNRLAGLLLEHLAYEEEQLAPVLARMTGPI